MDCAVAAPRVEYDHNTIRGVGRLAGLGGPIEEPDIEIAKVGRTTGVTRGIVTAFELDFVHVGYDIGEVRFDNQIEIEGMDDDPFSRGGDSGSLIVDSN